MTVKELILALKKMPKDAEVYFEDGPGEGRSSPEEVIPHPALTPEGRVQL